MQGGSLGGSGPGPQPRGKLRGIWSRPTPKGEVEGDLAKRVPAPREGSALGGACSRRGGGDPPPVTATAEGGTHPTGMHSCWYIILHTRNKAISTCCEFNRNLIYLNSGKDFYKETCQIPNRTHPDVVSTLMQSVRSV